MFQLKHFPVKQLLDPWYVTGLSERCGSFTYSISSGVYALYFAIKVGPSDLLILQALRAFFGDAGRIYHITPRSKTGEERRGSIYFRVTRQSDLGAVVYHFERYPLIGGKRLQFETWREMVSAKQQIRKPDLQKLAELSSSLAALRRPVT